MLDVGVVFGVVLGAVAAAAALYGRYRELPPFLTGPQVCKLEAGGCQVLFRTPTAALLGVPNAALGLPFYPLVLIGGWLGWPTLLLFVGATGAFGMTVYLAIYLVRNQLECRICWTGHVANTVLWLSLLGKLLGG